jgi:hypothetical protein
VVFSVGLKKLYKYTSCEKERMYINCNSFYFLSGLFDLEVILRKSEVN